MPCRSPRLAVFGPGVVVVPEFPEEPKGEPPVVAFWFFEHPARRSAAAVLRAKSLRRGFV
jgi:hypothetical protein